MERLICVYLRGDDMKPDEVEKLMNFKFPKRWMEVYQTGAMAWLELSREKFRADRDRYINDPKAFLMISSDCEPLPFDHYEEWKNLLDESLAMSAKYEDLHLQDDITLIPFGISGGGDFFCFWFEKGKENDTDEPKYIFFAHDDPYSQELIGESFDEFMYYCLLSAVSIDECIENEKTWNCQLEYIKGKYRNKLLEMTEDEMLDEFDSLLFKKPDIWKK